MPAPCTVTYGCLGIYFGDPLRPFVEPFGAGVTTQPALASLTQASITMAEFVESTTFLNIPEFGLRPGARRADGYSRRGRFPISPSCSTRSTKPPPKAASPLAAKRASEHESEAGASPARHGQRPAHRAPRQASANPRRTRLRVALGCSSWAAIMQLDDETRDMLEVAALLHDVGKIGVPDKVLLKPGRLSPEEVALMSRHAALTTEVLASSGCPQACS